MAESLLVLSLLSGPSLGLPALIGELFAGFLCAAALPALGETGMGRNSDIIFH